MYTGEEDWTDGCLRTAVEQNCFRVIYLFMPLTKSHPHPHPQPQQIMLATVTRYNGCVFRALHITYEIKWNSEENESGKFID